MMTESAGQLAWCIRLERKPLERPFEREIVVVVVVVVVSWVASLREQDVPSHPISA